MTDFGHEAMRMQIRVLKQSWAWGPNSVFKAIYIHIQFNESFW